VDTSDVNLLLEKRMKVSAQILLLGNRKDKIKKFAAQL
jgi:hypothetical protein